MTIYFLPYEKPFLKSINHIEGIDKFMKPANLSRWKKQTINNFNNKGSKFKKLYYEFLEDTIDIIEFEFIKNELFNFNSYINLERYIDVKLYPSLKKSKTFNINILNKKWTEWINSNENIYNKAFKDINQYFHHKILSYIHSFSMSVGDNCSYQQKTLSLILNKCQDFLDKKSYIRYYDSIWKSGSIYDGINDCLSLIFSKIAVRLKEFETDGFNKIGYLYGAGTEKGIIKTIDDYIPVPNKKMSLMFLYNVADEFKGRPYSGKCFRFRNHILKSLTDTPEINKFNMENKSMTGSLHFDEAYIWRETFILLSIYKFDKEKLNNKGLDDYLLKLFKDKVENHVL